MHPEIGFLLHARMIGTARLLLQLVRGRSRRGSHAERLQTFYAPQAERYDAFRERLLHGRRELISQLEPLPGASVVELGAGTGRNLLYFGARLHGFHDISLVDLCPALLEQARRRTREWANVRVIKADAAKWRPEGSVDCVYFSYSLTMMPDWRAAIDNAVSMLRAGGVLGVVDFYVSHASPLPGFVHHAPLARWFWQHWFGHEGVRLDARHLDYLSDALPDHILAENTGPMPFLPFLRVPYYRFVGRKPARPVA